MRIIWWGPQTRHVRSVPVHMAARNGHAVAPPHTTRCVPSRSRVTQVRQGGQQRRVQIVTRLPLFLHLLSLYSRPHLRLEFTAGVLWRRCKRRWRRHHAPAWLPWSSGGWDQTAEGTSAYSGIRESGTQYKTLATAMGSGESSCWDWDANLRRLLDIQCGSWQRGRGTGKESREYHITRERAAPSASADRYGVHIMFLMTPWTIAHST